MHEFLSEKYEARKEEQAGAIGTAGTFAVFQYELGVITERQKEVKCHLTAKELDDAIDEAQRADEARLVRQLMCMKTLYLSDTLDEAAQRPGVDSTTVGRWIDRWNGTGTGGLQPSFGGLPPPKLTDQQHERLKRNLAEYQPWITTEVRFLIEDAFDVSYSQVFGLCISDPDMLINYSGSWEEH